MGDADIEDGGKIEKAKKMTRQASESVCKVSKKVSKKSAGYTKLIINSIAGALPDSEIMIVALMAATVFIRAEESHLKVALEYCHNDGSVGWIITAMGCCMIAFSKYHDTRSMVHSLAAGTIYLLVQISLNYTPLGCLFSGAVSQSVYGNATKSLAVIQVIILLIFIIVYTVVIYRHRIEESEEEASDDEVKE
ncbi:hypothetical protein ACHWQZ_G014169 [Mnemiopsis leidyi]